MKMCLNPENKMAADCDCGSQIEYDYYSGSGYQLALDRLNNGRDFKRYFPIVMFAAGLSVRRFIADQ